jgi:hypothetical protein
VKSYLEKNPSQERAGGVVQSVAPEFKCQYHKKKKEKKKGERKRTWWRFCF